MSPPARPVGPPDDSPGRNPGFPRAKSRVVDDWGETPGGGRCPPIIDRMVMWARGDWACTRCAQGFVPPRVLPCPGFRPAQGSALGYDPPGLQPGLMYPVRPVGPPDDSPGGNPGPLDDSPGGNPGPSDDSPGRNPGPLDDSPGGNPGWNETLGAWGRWQCALPLYKQGAGAQGLHPVPPLSTSVCGIGNDQLLILNDYRNRPVPGMTINH